MIQTILNHARFYLGTAEGDKKHKDLVDKYNAVKPLPVGYKVKYTDDWCAVFVTVLMDLAGAAPYTGQECGVHRFSLLFKKRGLWIGLVKPRVGDIIIFDWRKDGWNDHIAIVEKLDGNVVTVIEGNTSKRVARRTYKYNDWRISSYARPKYPSGENNPKKRQNNDDIAREVIAGEWGNGDARKKRLADAGYDPMAVQETVNRLIKQKNNPLKTNQAIAKEVITGKWGNGDTRKTRLTQAGYDYNTIQKIVNKMM